MNAVLPHAPGDAAEGGLPALLAAQASQRPDAPCMREKRLGAWRRWTWRQVQDRVVRLAAGFVQRGLQRGERVAILNGGSPALAMAMLAVEAGGGVPVILRKADLGGAPLAELGIRRVIAERILDFVALDGTGGASWTRRYLASGSAAGSATVESLDAWLAIDDPAAPLPGAVETAFAVIETLPDGSLQAITLDHASVVAQARSAVRELGTNADARVLSAMPLAWVPGLVLGLVQSLLVGFCLSFAESTATVPRDLREIGPTLFVTPTAGLRALRRAAYLRAAPSVGWRYRLLAAALHVNGCRPGVLIRALVAKPLRDQLGFPPRAVILAVGPPPADAILGMFETLGVGVRILPAEGFTHAYANDVTLAGYDPELLRVGARLEGSPFIRHAVAVRRLDGTIGGLIALDDAAVETWAQRSGAGFDQNLPLSAQPAVTALIERETAGAAAAYVIAEASFSAEEGEVEADGTVVATAIAKRHHDALSRLVSGTAASFVAQSDAGPARRAAGYDVAAAA